MTGSGQSRQEANGIALTQNHLSEENVANLAKAFHAYEDIERLARIVPMGEVEANDRNLNISRYVQVGTEAEDLDVAEEVKKLVELQAQRNAAEAKMMGFLKELGYVD